MRRPALPKFGLFGRSEESPGLLDEITVLARVGVIASSPDDVCWLGVAAPLADLFLRFLAMSTEDRSVCERLDVRRAEETTVLEGKASIDV